MSALDLFPKGDPLGDRKDAALRRRAERDVRLGRRAELRPEHVTPAPRPPAAFSHPGGRGPRRLPAAGVLEPLEAIEKGSPLVVNLGMGVDSTSILVRFAELGIRPDLIVFSDVGCEKDATYAVLGPLREWLRDVGFPDVVVVRRAPPTGPYKSLFGNCLANDTPPSIATTGGTQSSASCSVEWKKRVIDRYVERWGPAIRAWASGLPVVRVIGFDSSKADAKRATKVTKSDEAALASEAPLLYWYPLQEKKTAASISQWYPLQQWGWGRDECKAAIEASELGAALKRASGSPIPPKSSCTMCAAMKHWEVLDLARTEPHNALLCLALEERAKTGKNRFGRPGLGINWNWAEWLEAQLAKGVEGIEWVAHWREEAADLGLLDDAWYRYSKSVGPWRAELDAAKKARKKLKAQGQLGPRERAKLVRLEAEIESSKRILKPMFAPDRPVRPEKHAAPEGGWAHLEPQGCGLKFRLIGPSLEVAESPESAALRVSEDEAKKARKKRLASLKARKAATV